MTNDFEKVQLKRPSFFDRLLVGKKELVGAEIGVWKGEHAWAMLNQLDIKKLYLIDPYQAYEGYTGLGLQSPQEILMSEMFAKKLLKDEGHEDQIEWIAKFSKDAVKDVKEDLDFVYIDGNHEYKYVFDDISRWSKKVKTGGLVGGHDYNIVRGKAYADGVIRAINTYCDENKIKFEVSGEEWYYWK